MTTEPSGIITDVNKQMEALTGYTRDELIGAPFKNYFTDPERAEAAIKLVLREENVTNYELTASALDGKKTVVSCNATTFYERVELYQACSLLRATSPNASVLTRCWPKRELRSSSERLIPPSGKAPIFPDDETRVGLCDCEQLSCSLTRTVVREAEAARAPL